MEKINEIINTFEGEIKREIEIEILKKFESGLNSLNTLIEQVSKKEAGEEGETGDGEASLSLRERITNFEESLSGVIEDTNEKFANLIKLTKKLETEKSLKEFITSTMQDIFGNLAEETSKEFNLSTYQTFKDIMNQLKREMETEIFTKLDKELFNIKDGFKKFENISEILENQFSSIQEAITNIKQNYQQELRAISKENEVREEQFQALEGASKTLSQKYQDIQNVVGESLINIQQTLSKLLEQLKEELTTHEKQFLSYKTDSKTSSEEAETLKKENLKMKTELEWVSQFIEKSPKFQLLYLLSNLEEANLNKIKELTDSLQRLQAEFENYKKRIEKEKLEFVSFANKELILRILPVIDSFELALQNTNSYDEFVKGVKLIYTQLFSMLESLGVQKIKAQGEKFDPYKHEVMLQEKSDKEEGTIIEELQKGYLLSGRVIRHSKVKISKGA